MFKVATAGCYYIQVSLKSLVWRGVLQGRRHFQKSLEPCLNFRRPKGWH